MFMRRKGSGGLSLLLAGVAGWWLLAAAGAAAPRGEPVAPLSPEEAEARIAAELAAPFCYLLRPSDVLGFMDCPEGTQVTWDAALNTGFGELNLYAGAPLTRVRQRVRTLERGYLPIIQYAWEQGGVQYAVEAFGAPLDLDPRGNLINFVRLTARNTTAAPAEAAWGAVFREVHGEDRCPLSCEDWYRAQFMAGDALAPLDRTEVRDGAVWRGDHLVLTCDPAAAAAERVPDDADCPAPLLVWRGTLAPGGTQVVTLKLPLVPITADRAAVRAALDAAGYDAYRRRVIDFWEQVLARALQIDVPEEKVVHAQRANLIYDLIARDIDADGKHFTQKVNEFQYDHFYPRDTAYIARSYDLYGLHDIARQSIAPFLSYDDDGAPVNVRRLMPDDWGQSLWALGSHARITHDRAFAERIYGPIRPHVEALVDGLRTEPLGLWAAAGRYDNEVVDGHYTGHNFWVLLGLREARGLAERVGADDDARWYQEIHDAYLARFLPILRAAAATAEGYIPPGIDDALDGHDWANASGGVHPFGVLDPHDPLVTATLALVREYKYREGLMTWGPNAWRLVRAERSGQEEWVGWLHHYQTMYVTETLLARGEQRKVIEDFYAILAHTSSTHAGFEFMPWPWGWRTAHDNYTPHGWFAARYNTLLRNMLVCERGDELHLAGALSPEWLAPGRRVGVRSAATDFGPVSYTLAAAADGATLTLEADWRQAPARVVLHVPWFVRVSDVTGDGAATLADGRVVLDPAVRRVTLAWTWQERPELSFRKAVELYLDKYYRRPADADYDFLFPTPRRPRLAAAPDQFVGTGEYALTIPAGGGTIHYTLDGSAPSADSPAYTAPLRLNDTTTLQALTRWPDGRCSDVLRVTLRRVAPRAADGPAATTPGLRREVWAERVRRTDEIDALRDGQVDVAAECTLDGLPEGVVALRCTGYVDVPADGVYTFFTRSDDGSRLYIGDTLVVDNDGEHMARELGGSIALARGRHALRVVYFDIGGGDRALTVSWQGPGLARQPLPAAALSHAAP
jgi:hypothetical protein